MKNKLKSSVFFLCLVIILSGCNKSDSNSVNGSFGFGESENNILDDSVTPDISINSSNKFSIDESNKVAQNILKSEEDIKQEEILEELESIAEESESTEEHSDNFKIDGDFGGRFDSKETTKSQEQI